MEIFVLSLIFPFLVWIVGCTYFAIKNKYKG